VRTEAETPRTRGMASTATGAAIYCYLKLLPT